MPIGITILAATLAYGGVIVGKVKIARARARVRRRLEIETTGLGDLSERSVGSIVKVVGSVRIVTPCAGPLSGRGCAAWEVALRPGRGPKQAMSLRGGCDFELVDGAGRSLLVRWDPSAQLLFGSDLSFSYARRSARGDGRAGAVMATVGWSRRVERGELGERGERGKLGERGERGELGEGASASASGLRRRPQMEAMTELDGHALPDVAGFQRRFSAAFGVDDLVLPPKRGALVGEERLLSADQRVALVGRVTVDESGGGDGRRFALVGADGCPLAITNIGARTNTAAAASTESDEPEYSYGSDHERERERERDDDAAPE